MPVPCKVMRCVPSAVAFVIVAIALTAPLTAERDQMPATGVERVNRPEAPGSQAVEARCLSCHAVDLIRGQRLSRAGWEREVEKMIGWGAQLSATERRDIIDYLSADVGLSMPTPAESEATAADALLPRCLTCHDLRLIEQQRLTRAGWIREIDKMIGWGATLSESERGLLSDYLAKRFAPER